MTCTHYALKTSQQPCPHPECWRHGERLYVPRRSDPATYADVVAPAPVATDVHERSRIAVPGIGEVWAWRPAS